MYKEYEDLCQLVSQFCWNYLLEQPSEISPTLQTMDLFRVTTPQFSSKAERARSEDREAAAPPARPTRRTSLPAHHNKNGSVHL